jgi:hypothetical protein
MVPDLTCHGASMNYVRFLVDSSIGELEVELFEDGWTGIELSARKPGSSSVENIVRRSDDLAKGFGAMGLPEDEADALGKELWNELDEEERKERSQLRAVDESRKGSKPRTGRS